MIDVSNIPHHTAIEEIATVLSRKTQNNDIRFFRVLTAYFLTTIASSMRAHLKTNDRGTIPINGYMLAFAPSGAGKGHSISVLENTVLKDFRDTFINFTFPALAEKNMARLAMQRAAMKGTTEEEELARLEREYERTGAYQYVFDGGTAPAVKQMRQKLLIAKAGSLNLQIDEIGSNLIGSTELLNAYLELYDLGIIKDKLTKNTNENVRSEPIEGKTPTNMLLFGAPEKLLDGGQTEDHFYKFLEIGYARRSIFAYGEPIPLGMDMSASEIYDFLTDPANATNLDKWSQHFAYLGDLSKIDWEIEVPRHVSELIIEYESRCKKAAFIMPENEHIRSTELKHRYFKAMKIAGALAFIEEADVLTEDHVLAGIKLVEESGESFQRIFTRDKPYMKLAKYIGSYDGEITHADLHESLPFYKQSTAYRTEIMNMAMSWAYKQHIIIKKFFRDGIEFFTGESLKETSLDAVKLSYSQDFAKDYEEAVVPFSQLAQLITEKDYHWCNHTFLENHRREENAVPGFNLLVMDIDGTAQLDVVHDLLKEYAFLTYTTKRHTEEVNRFRVVMPINYELKLDKKDYHDFMKNVERWFPVEVDASTFQRSKKWLTNDQCVYHFNEGEMLDIIPFIPKTAKNEEYQKNFKPLESLSNLERWFAQRIAEGNRNNEMLKYAMALVDNGMPYDEVEKSVLSFNERLTDSLSVEELRKTVLVTVARKIQGMA